MFHSLRRFKCPRCKQFKPLEGSRYFLVTSTDSLGRVERSRQCRECASAEDVLKAKEVFPT